MYHYNEILISDYKIISSTKIIEYLITNQITIATAESITGGLLGAKITSVSGSSSIYECGIISYSNNIKHKLLNVSNDVLTNYGAVSKECAYLMAKGISILSPTDIAISVTGLAGPTGKDVSATVGDIYFCIKYLENYYVYYINLTDERNVIRNKIVDIIFNQVYLLLVHS